MKILALVVGSLILAASCGEDQTAILVERQVDPGTTIGALSSQTVPPTTQREATETDICGAFDVYFDRLFADPDIPRTSDELFGEDIFDAGHPIAKLDDGPFGQAWTALLTNIGSQEPTGEDPLIDESEFAELDELSRQQCGYPVLTALSVDLACATDSNGVELCSTSGDPRVGYEESQAMIQRADSFFATDGIDWLSELPGEEVARRDGTAGHSEVLLRVKEDQVPEIGAWIAEFLEANEFDLDDDEIETLRSPLFWSQAEHRSTYLSLTVVGGLFGDYTYPTNPDGLTMNVRSLASPALNPGRGDELQDLYLIGSELSNGLLTNEEILPIYQDLAPEESLLLISF